MLKTKKQTGKKKPTWVDIAKKHGLGTYTLKPGGLPCHDADLESILRFRSECKKKGIPLPVPPEMRKTVEVTFMTMIPAGFADRFIENKIEMKMGKFAIIFTRKDTGEKHKAIFEFKDMVVDGNYVR